MQLEYAINIGDQIEFSPLLFGHVTAIVWLYGVLRAVVIPDNLRGLNHCLMLHDRTDYVEVRNHRDAYFTYSELEKLISTAS